MNFNNRSTVEQELIRKAYDFEAEAIRLLSKTSEDLGPNPWLAELRALPDGQMLYEALNEALELAFN